MDILPRGHTYQSMTAAESKNTINLPKTTLAGVKFGPVREVVSNTDGV